MIDPLEFGLEQECYPAKKPSQLGGECEEEPPKEEDPCEECQNCRKKRKPCLQRLKGLCKRCKGHGCQTCNFGGHAPEICEPCVPVDGCQACGVPVEMPCQECEPCKVHNGCITCCPSKKILAELKRIAFEPDRDREGCYYEPSIDLRNLALEALNVCPPLKDDTDNDNNNNKVPETGDTPEVDRSRPTEGVPSSGTDGAGSSVLDDQSSNRVNSFVPISHRRATPSSELMMTARVVKFYSNGFLIQFSEDYLIPVNKKLLIEMADGRHAIVQVIKSDVGVAQVMPTDGQIFRTASPTLYVGVIDE